MNVSLHTIADVQTGYSFRARLEHDSSGMIAVIQMKDLTEANQVNCSELARIDLEHLKPHHLVQPGDLIFRSRGLSSSAALLADDPGRAVLAAPLLRIRITNHAVLPEYLTWYISQPPAQAYLTSCAEGTNIKMISKQSLENLTLPVPPIGRQRLIVELAALAAEELRIVKTLAEKCHQQISATLLQVAQGA